ncbi:hypothetical protein BSC11_01790 [Salmonella enterica]|nr:hypothetical protein [Salmonella enterica]
MKYNRICQILGIEKPVIQGPLSWLTDARLVAAVSNAGGLGVLGPNAGLTAETAVSTPEETAEKMREEIRKTKKLTEKPFGVNLIPTPENDIWTPPILQVIKEEGVKAVVYTGYGEGAIITSLFNELKASGIAIIYRDINPTPENTRLAEKAGADIIVATGFDEGGTLPGTALGTFSIVPLIADSVKSVPVMAAGGITDSRTARAAHALGAEGVFAGSVFIGTEESRVPQSVKDKIINANGLDLLLFRTLLANGHRRIACVTSDLPIIDRQERLDGYRQALEEYGISPDPRWVISVPFNEEGGERAAHQLINSGLPLTAAVTFNDVMAAGIMRILHQRGVQLPQQLSIVGFDDVVLARYLYPALTTMHYPVEQMARCAAQLAIQLYQGITPPPSSNHFNAELVIRDSVAPYFSR